MSEEKPVKWDCEARPYDQPPVISLKELFVGDKFLLRCSGDFVEGVSLESLKLRFEDPSEQYSLSLLEVRTFEPDEMWAEVTIYKPGEHKFVSARLDDGLQTIPLKIAPVVVQSQLQVSQQKLGSDPEALKQLQKITFMGPFELSFPLWFWLIIGALAIAGLGGIGNLFFQKSRKKRGFERGFPNTSRLCLRIVSFIKKFAAICESTWGLRRNNGHPLNLLSILIEVFGSIC